MRSVASVCVCPARALTFECVDLETSFLYVFIASRSRSSIRVIGQGLTSITKYTFVGGLPSSELRSCSNISVSADSVGLSGAPATMVKIMWMPRPVEISLDFAIFSIETLGFAR